MQYLTEAVPILSCLYTSDGANIVKRMNHSVKYEEKNERNGK